MSMLGRTVLVVPSERSLEVEACDAGQTKLSSCIFMSGSE